MAKIYAPNPKFDGVTAGVSFSQGVGECENVKLLAWFRKKGYRVEEPLPPTEEPLPPAATPKGSSKAQTAPSGTTKKVKSEVAEDDSAANSPPEAPVGGSSSPA